MDLLAAEIARKRKAKADEFGGSKYVKRSQIVAVREGKIRVEEEAEARAKRAKTGGTGSDDGSPADDDDTAVHADGDDERRARSKTAEGTKGNARKDNDKNTAVDPDALDAEIAKAGTNRGDPPAPSPRPARHALRRAPSRPAQAPAAHADAAGLRDGARGTRSHRRASQREAGRAARARRIRKASTRKGNNASHREESRRRQESRREPRARRTHRERTTQRRTMISRRRSRRRRRRSPRLEPRSPWNPSIKRRCTFKSLIDEWERELESKPEDWVYSNAGKQSVANCRLCKQHMRPLFKRMKRRELPVDIERALFLIVKNMKDRNYRKAADMYIGIAVGNAAWPIGVTSVGIHDRSAREKISAQTQAHAMHDEETRKYLQSIKRLITFAQRAYPTTPSLSLDFNSGYNGWDKDSLIEADAKLDIKAQVPALLALPANGDGWKAQDGDTRTWKSLLTHAYEGTEFAKRKGKVDMDKIRTMKDEIIARDKGMYDARSGHLGKGFGERNDERNRG